MPAEAIPLNTLTSFPSLPTSELPQHLNYHLYTYMSLRCDVRWKSVPEVMCRKEKRTPTP